MTYILALLTIRSSIFLHKCGLGSIECFLAFLWNVPKALPIQGELLARPTIIEFGSTIIALAQIIGQKNDSFFNLSFSKTSDSSQEDLSLGLHEGLVELDTKHNLQVSLLTPTLNLALFS